MTERDANEIFHLFEASFCNRFNCIYQPHLPNLSKGLSLRTQTLSSIGKKKKKSLFLGTSEKQSPSQSLSMGIRLTDRPLLYEGTEGLTDTSDQRY